MDDFIKITAGLFILSIFVYCVAYDEPTMKQNEYIRMCYTQYQNTPAKDVPMGCAVTMQKNSIPPNQ